MSMTLIETKTLASTTSTIQFTSIPQTYTDLLALISSRDNGTNGTIQVTFNGSSSNYSRRQLDGYGSGSPATGFQNLNAETSVSTNSNETANTFSNNYFYLANYAGNTAKSYYVENVSENNATAALIRLNGALWNDTSAITSILFDPLVGDFVAGTTISLYGILKGSDGTTVVS